MSTNIWQENADEQMNLGEATRILSLKFKLVDEASQVSVLVNSLIFQVVWYGGGLLLLNEKACRFVPVGHCMLRSWYKCSFFVALKRLKQFEVKH